MFRIFLMFCRRVAGHPHSRFSAAVISGDASHSFSPTVQSEELFYRISAEDRLRLTAVAHEMERGLQARILPRHHQAALIRRDSAAAPRGGATFAPPRLGQPCG